MSVRDQLLKIYNDAAAVKAAAQAEFNKAVIDKLPTNTSSGTLETAKLAMEKAKADLDAFDAALLVQPEVKPLNTIEVKPLNTIEVKPTNTKEKKPMIPNWVFIFILVCIVLYLLYQYNAKCGTKPPMMKFRPRTRPTFF